MKAAPFVLAAAGAAAIIACGPAKLRSTVEGAPPRGLMAEFWVDPGRGRDLYHGPWGAKYAPGADPVF